ncbi:MAG: methylcobamide--CoM methyltransferase [Chloroflexota bacterium]|nr:methylcobamide--CoM methyltransferase [Chloroflexota bacterium]
MITTAVGNYPKTPNLPRPAKLRKAIADLDAGKITVEELNRVADQVTREVIDEQIGAGLDLITDGKIRWEDEQTYLARGLTGFSINGLIRYFDSNTYYRQPVCESAVAWQRPITVRDYEFAVQHSTQPIKPTLTGPYTLARLSENKHYQTLDEFVFALADALNQEAHALERAGARFIQFDEPAILRHKEDWSLFEKAMQRLTQGLTARLALYTYFGDVSGIYPRILALPFAVIGLDFVQGKRNWSIISRAKFTKELGFGVVDARNTRLETHAELHRAFTRISRIVPLDRVYVNPTCGLEFLPRERAQEKLVNMVKAVKRYKPGKRKPRKVTKTAKASKAQARPRKR